MHIIGNNINKIIYENYNSIDELNDLFDVLIKLEKYIDNISRLSIVFNILNTKSNIINVNKFTKKILGSKFFQISKSKVLIYDKDVNSIRQFSIVLDNDECFKHMDIHIIPKSRVELYRERTLNADP